MSILVSRDETDIDTSQINVVVFCLNPLASRVSVLNWFRVSFSTDIGQGESILTENFGKTCCIWSVNSQNGAICGILCRILRRRILGYRLQKSFKLYVLVDPQTSFTT